MTMSFWDDITSGPSLSGALSGAATGGMIGGPWGAGIGAGIGLFGGAMMNDKLSSANAMAQANQLKMIQQIQQMNRANYRQHIADINKALSFYSVPQQQWDKLYGSGGGAPPPTTGQGTWSATGVK